MKFKQGNTHTIQCMGQDISLKSERKTHDLNHDLTFSAHTINCVCHSMTSMFRVLGVYNFAFDLSEFEKHSQNNLISCSNISNFCQDNSADLNGYFSHCGNFMKALASLKNYFDQILRPFGLVSRTRDVCSQNSKYLISLYNVLPYIISSLEQYPPFFTKLGGH